MKQRISVVGGMNTDICGQPDKTLIGGDSNIGRVTLSCGGVGRNIAANLANLGFSVSLITAMGDDAFARENAAECAARGISLEHAAVFFGGSSSVYMFINDAGGDMLMAVNDMALCERLTPERIHMDDINSSSLCVIDANIPAETIEYIVDNASVPVFADPVSANKARRMKRALSKLHTIKPNALEAAALTGESDPVRAAATLVSLGVKRVFVSLGGGGMVYASKHERGLCHAHRIDDIITTTGAGDAATAGLCASWLEGRDMASSAEAACALAAKTLCCAQAVYDKPLKQKG